MRALFLLHGAPGTGKSTLVQRLGVEDLTIGYDMFRELFSVAFPCAEVDDTVSETIRLTSDAEHAAVSAAHDALMARMAAGSTVFFDATMSRAADQATLAKLAAKYGYRTWLIDCQGDTSIGTLLERNRKRGRKRVDEQVLIDIHARCAQKPTSALITGVISGTRATDEIADDIDEITNVPRVRINERQSVIVVGDVHSCAEALQEAMDALDDSSRYWVFAGDLFDRGSDPVGVWNIVHRLLDEGRATVVTGNHELNLRAVNNHTASTRFSDTRDTRDALLSAGILAAEQTSFVNSTVPMLLLHVGDALWTVTHGGIGETTDKKAVESWMLRVSDAECIYGLGDRAHTYRAKSSYNVADMPLLGFQLHGHRNGRAGVEPVSTITTDRYGQPIVCLESGVSAGGSLTVAVLDHTGEIGIHRFDDHVDPSLAERNRAMPWQRKKPVDPADASDLLARMRESEHVRVHEVEGVRDVVACNFTRRAFIEGAWDELTVHARGLFIDEGTGKIAARGYEKFFHIGERPGRSLEEWMNPMVTAYPVVVRRKVNGFLALVASIHGKLEVFSKSGVTPYSRFARQLLVNAIGQDGAAQLRGMLERTNTTAVFEVVAACDPHPITETGPDRLVLLDCIRNHLVFATDDAIRTGIARRFGFEVAETVTTAEGPAELQAALNMAADRRDEGVVLVDADGVRSKVKADAYAERKAARTALERVWRGASSTLGSKFAELEGRLVEHGIMQRISNGAFTVAGVDGSPRLDLAHVFDALDEASQGIALGRHAWTRFAALPEGHPNRTKGSSHEG